MFKKGKINRIKNIILEMNFANNAQLMNIFISNIVLQLVLWELIRMWQVKENVEYVQHILDLQKLEVLTASVTKVIIEQSMKLYTMDAHVSFYKTFMFTFYVFSKFYIFSKWYKLKFVVFEGNLWIC